jgi:TM2 domain-containing membrane protein YozV
MLISCIECEGRVSDKASACPHCGAPVGEVLTAAAAMPVEAAAPTRDMGTYILYDAHKKSAPLAFVLCFFFGMFGAHRFYMGRFGSGLTQLIISSAGGATAALLIGWPALIVVWIWVLIDAFQVLGWVRDHNLDVLSRIEVASARSVDAGSRIFDVPFASDPNPDTYRVTDDNVFVWKMLGGLLGGSALLLGILFLIAKSHQG